MEGLPALRALLEAGHRIECAFTLADESLAQRSGPVDYEPLCAAHDVPLLRIRNVNDEETVARLSELALDYLFVIGWSQIVRAPAMATIRRGLIGAHASLLPHNRGSAPINWAIIHGEERTGNTLIWLAEGVDSGDVIDQREFPITPFDTCATLYERVAETNRDMILALFPRLLAGEVPRRPQPPTDEPVLARRRPQDGAIDWRRSARELYDFVRALTRPYPGAFGTLGLAPDEEGDGGDQGGTWRVWRAAHVGGASAGGAVPGTVLGPLLSPEAAACGLAVATGDGVLALLELEDEHGRVLAGRALAEQPWQGARFAS